MKKLLIVCLAVMLTLFCGCSGTKGTAGKALKTATEQNLVKVPKETYKVRTVTYKFKEGKKSFRAEYPQISENNKNYDKVNSLLKQTAMQTIDSIGTADTASYAEVKVTSHVSHDSAVFLSVTYQESSRTSNKAAEKNAFRTVNYDLKSDAAVTAKDLVQNNDALKKALENSVKGQMSPKKAASYSDPVIQAGLNSYSVYFKGNAVGFSLTVPDKLGSHVELLVNYSETNGFRTNSPVWSYFIKK